MNKNAAETACGSKNGIVDKAARKVADAAVAHEIVSSAIARFCAIHDRKLVTPGDDQEAIFRLVEAQRASIDAQRHAIREYRALTESPKTTCVVNGVTRTLSAEQLRRLLNDHKQSLLKRCFELKQAATRMEKDIAAVDELLAELTIG